MLTQQRSCSSSLAAASVNNPDVLSHTGTPDEASAEKACTQQEQQSRLWQ